MRVLRRPFGTRSRNSCGRIDKLEDDSDETKKELEHVRRELQFMQKEMNRNDKIQRHQGHAMVEMEQRIKKLESEKRGKAISAGKAKAKLAKYEEERRPPRH